LTNHTDENVESCDRIRHFFCPPVSRAARALKKALPFYEEEHLMRKLWWALLIVLIIFALCYRHQEIRMGRGSQAILEGYRIEVSEQGELLINGQKKGNVPAGRQAVLTLTHGKLTLEGIE
jgi:hypothetical protein